MRRPKCDGMLHKALGGRIGFGQDRALSAAETLPILFKRRLDTHQMTFAMGEALAHLHYLWMQGKVKRFLDQAGVLFHRHLRRLQSKKPQSERDWGFLGCKSLTMTYFHTGTRTIIG
eukprot:gene8133-11013_t